MSERWILHIDLDAMFAAVEALLDPSLTRSASLGVPTDEPETSSAVVGAGEPPPQVAGAEGIPPGGGPRARQLSLLPNPDQRMITGVPTVAQSQNHLESARLSPRQPWLPG